ncbi:MULTISPECIES: GlsB/YeaQ/YmgE family stress response membrane protein [Catellatospora]|jgi:uncharacterized membrane protein YeaQ/YmgE (transglycosylase-associated protein family)|uniref:Transglycosylase n=1 Tax=Catellatospora coxensis TaxID=310354 RepID=A0A8J3KTD2_9ACTN|nr:GlsB/YeaQ/YmgE family stress response membrane protein [Catellatospora coxensis]GIG06755.1 transglycosylase [Catellatospora coxensis]
MTATGILSAILIGIVIGTLGRLVLPGRQNIGVIATFVVGILAALLGTWVSRQMGWESMWPARLDWNWAGWHFTWSWSELLVQVVCAVIGIIIAMALTRTFIADEGGRPVRRRRRNTTT